MTEESPRMKEMRRRLADAPDTERERFVDSMIELINNGLIEENADLEHQLSEANKRIKAQDRTIALQDTTLIEADKKIEKLEKYRRMAGATYAKASSDLVIAWERVEKLKACVEEVEFVDDYCPWCEDANHAPDCQRQEALGETRG